MPPPSPYASILIPTRDPGERIVEVLTAVFAQRTDFPFEVVVVDSGSCHQDIERLSRFPIRLHHIPPREFHHGRTRNLLATLAQGQVLVFLSQDARPADDGWFATLVAALEERGVGGVYARQLPTPTANPLEYFMVNHLYGPTPARRTAEPSRPLRLDDLFFSGVSAAVRREVWEQIPFRSDVSMSEDQYWAHDALRAGFDLVYEPRAAVYHSHAYTLRSLFDRNRRSGASLQGLIADGPRAVVWRGSVFVAREARFLMSGGHLKWLPYMLLYELTRSVGFAVGASAARRH